MNPKANHKNGWTVHAARRKKVRGDIRINKPSKNGKEEIQYKLVPKPQKPKPKPKKPRKPKPKLQKGGKSKEKQKKQSQT